LGARPVAGEDDPGAEADDLLSLGDGGEGERQQQGQDQDQQRPECFPQATPRVVQPRHHGPIGMFSTSAISRYESPSRSLNMIMVRCGSDKVASARLIRSRSSTSAAWRVGRGPGVGQRAVPVRLLDALGAEGRAAAGRVLAGAVARHVHHDAKEPGVEGGVAAEG
jgi:hypothetical protein